MNWSIAHQIYVSASAFDPWVEVAPHRMVFRAERVEINDVLRTAPAHMVSFRGWHPEEHP